MASMSDQVSGTKRKEGSPSNQQANKHLKIVQAPAPNPNVNPMVPMTYPGSNQNIPWPRLLRPLLLINAVHLESVSRQFQRSVFAGQHRLVWNFKYRNFLSNRHQLLGNNFRARNLALLFLVKKIGPFCRQLIIKDFQHPASDQDQEIFANLPILESVYLKYGQHERMQENLTFEIMNDSFQTFLRNAQTRLAALQNTGKAEIRINCDPRECPKKLQKPIRRTDLGTVLTAFGAFLAERRESLISLQLAPFEKYYMRNSEANYFQLDIKKLQLPDGTVHLRKLRVAYQRVKDPEDSTRLGVQYKAVLRPVIEHLDTLYIKWGEEETLDLHQVGRDDAFLCPLSPIWNNRTTKKPKPIPLRALAIDFNWVNVFFRDEPLHRIWFNQSWHFVGETFSKALSEDRFRKLSLNLPYSHSRPEQGCFYFSEAFIQKFVQNRSLDYLRLVFKAMPGVPLKFGLAQLGTLEISFSCLKTKTFSSELVQAATNVSGDPTKPGILFDLDGKFWKPSIFGFSVRSLKLKYAPYFDEDLAKHLATAFPNLVMFSFTAFHEDVYNQGNFLRGLRMLLERIYSLRVIKLGDSFNKNGVDLFQFLRDLQARANNDTRRFVFYARNATVDERSQTILDNSRLVGSNFRITVETFPRIQVQGEMYRELLQVMEPQFPNVGLPSSPSLALNRPEYAPVGTSQQTPPRLFPNLPSSTAATSRAPSPGGYDHLGLANINDFPGNQPNYQFPEMMQSQPQPPNHWLQSSPSAPLHWSQNAPDLPYQQPQPHLVPLQPNPAAATSRAPFPGGYDHLGLANINDFPPNVQPAPNVPGQAANQRQPPPSPAAESAAADFAMFMAEIDKQAKK